MSHPQLRLFTNPHLLSRVGYYLGFLFSRFDHPFPPADTSNESYFNVIAKLCSSPKLPDHVLQELLKIEALTAPENLPSLHIPTNVDPQDRESVPLFHAIGHWLAAHPAQPQAPAPTLPPPKLTAPPAPATVSHVTGNSPPAAPDPEPVADSTAESPLPPPLRLKLYGLFYGIDPDLRHAFFQRFRSDLRYAFPRLPETSANSEIFDDAVISKMSQPGLLPRPMFDALLAIQELAAPQNHLLLLHLARQYCPTTRSTNPQEIAIALWLRHPIQWQDLPRLSAQLPPPPPLHEAAAADPASPPPSEPDPNPEALAGNHPLPGDLAALARFPRHKIARLPAAARDTINRLLRQRIPYSQILLQLGPDAAGLNKTNLWRWKKTGYLLWLSEQQRREEAQAQLQLLFDLLRENDNAKIHEATQQIAALRIGQVLAAFDPAALTQSLQQQPQALVRLIQTLPNLSRGGTDCERLLIELAERRASLDAAANPRKRIPTSSELRAIAEQINLM